MADYPEIDGAIPVGMAPTVKPGEVRVRIFRRPPERDASEGRGERQSGRDEERRQLERSVRDLLERVNNDLARQGLAIHLVLLPEGNGYLLEIYDCSDSSVCAIVKEEIVTLNELPALITRLQKEVGVLFNAFS